MAIFASTTLGNNDAIRANTIKALEKRQADLLAQQAQQQPDTATMATIPGGIGHVLGIVGDNMREARTGEALKANRAELSNVIAQIDPATGPTPAQGAVIARLAPEVFKDYMSQQQERWRVGQEQSGMNRRTDAQIAGTENTAAGNRRSAEGIAQAREAGETGRTVIQTTSNEAIAGNRIGSEERRQGLEHQHQATQARLNAELAQVQKDRDNAFTAGQTDLVRQHDQTLARLNSELRGGEERNKERFRLTEIDALYSKDAKLQGLAQEARRAEIQMQIAASAGENDKKIEAQERLARIQGEIEVGKQDIKARYDQEAQARAEAHKTELQQRQIKADADTAKAAAEAKVREQAADPKRNEAIRNSEVGYRAGLSHIKDLEEAAGILDTPNGIYTGAAQNVAPIVGGIPVLDNLVDKEKAQRTARYNSLLGADAVKDMSATLNGPTTNFELQKFEKMRNDPNISDAARAAQLRNVITAARADLEARAKEAKAIGGDTARVDKALGAGAAAPAPAAGGGGAPTDQNAEARKWLEANPNDPRAAAVRKKLEGK